MAERSQKGLEDGRRQRYSLTIPPERRGKISGVYKIDTTKVAKLKSFLMVPGEKRKDWLIGGTILKAFDCWKLLPPQITENDCEERREILNFLANRDEFGGYGPLPSLEAISIEIARILLGTLDEWDKLEPATQFIAERDIILFINQQHPEFEETPDKHNIKDEFTILEAPHHLPTQSSYHQAEEQIRQKIIANITAKIAELADEYGNGDYDKNRVPSSEETRLATITEMTSRSAREAIRPIAPANSSAPPPLESSVPKRRSIIPTILSWATRKRKE